jgi:Ca2+-binding RTX toxin-like protein
MAIFNGTDASDTFVGTAEADSIVGAAGADTLQGSGGADTISGSAPGDAQETDSDLIDGGEGADVLFAGLYDRVLGGEGNDLLTYQHNGPMAGIFTYDGGAGVDALVLKVNINTPYIVASDDAFEQHPLGARLISVERVQLAGDVAFYGGSADDLITLQPGWLDAYQNTVTFDGGGGQDTLSFENLDPLTIYGPAWTTIKLHEQGAQKYLTETHLGEPLPTQGSGLPTPRIAEAAGDLRLSSVENFIGSAVKDIVEGSGAANRLEGRGGNDEIQGLSGDDTLIGGQGSDTLSGGADSDVLDGGSGAADTEADLLYGGAGDDTLTGGRNDILHGGSGADRFVGQVSGAVSSTNSPTVSYSDATQAVTVGGEYGGSGDAAGDTFVNIRRFQLSDHNDVFWGEAGPGVLVDAGSGNDVLAGGSGNDTLLGGLGHDGISGGAGADDLKGGAGDDILGGEEGADDLFGGEGQDSMYGGNAGDWLYDGDSTAPTSMQTGDDLFEGGDGNDVLTSVNGKDTLDGGNGNDRLKDGSGDNDLRGGEGDDTIQLAGGADWVDAGNGNDTIEVNGAGQKTITGGGGDDRYVGVRAGVNIIEYEVGGRDEVVVAADIRSFALAEFLEDLSGEDLNGEGATLTGNAVGNRMEGSRYAERLEGLGGDDTLTGAGAQDTLVGGTGDDRYYVTNAQEAVVESAGEGVDTVVSSADSYTLAANVENLEAAIGKARVLIGNELNNSIKGGAGADTIEGGAGNDTLNAGTSDGDVLIGGAGDDVYITGFGQDKVFTELAGGGVDEVRTSIRVFQLADNIENLVRDDAYQGTLNFDWTGNDLNNLIVGGQGADTLRGGNGDDHLKGVESQSHGGDELVGGEGHDRAYFEGERADYRVVAKGSGWYDVVSISGERQAYVHRLHGVEEIQFADGVFAIDTLLAGAAKPDAIDVAEDASTENLWATLLANDTGVGGKIVSVSSVGTKGTVSFSATNQRLTYSADDPTFDALEPGQTVTDSFTYTVEDATGLRTTATVTVTVQGRDEWIDLTVGNDTASYGEGAQSVRGGEGADTISGGGGDDHLQGQAGADRLTGGTGADQLSGGADNDVVVGGLGDVRLAGDDGVDRAVLDFAAAAEGLTFSVAETQDAVVTLAGVEISGFEQVDMTGSEHADHLTGGALADTLRGGGGADTLVGQGGGDSLSGGAGDDLIHVWAGDRVSGGTGRNTLVLQSQPPVASLTSRMASAEPAAPLEIADFDADDVLDISLLLTDGANPFANGLLELEQRGADTVLVLNRGGQSVDVATFQGVAAASVSGGNFVATAPDGKPVEVVIPTHVGTGSGEQLDGSAGADLMLGLGGDDLIRSAAGNDTLDGGEGVDFLVGGAGDDLYIADRLEDVIIESAGQGRDTVIASSTFLLKDAVEDLTLTGEGDFEAHGNGLDNTLRGNAGANRMFGQGGEDQLFGGDGDDTLDGGTGADTMVGGQGDDLYIVGHMADQVQEALGEGHDRVESSVTFTLSSGVEDLVLTGSGVINGTGNGGANRLVGNMRNNLLDGLEGDDHLEGGVGHDTLTGGFGADTIDGGQGNDLLEGGEGHDLMLGGEGRDTLTGAAGDDTLEGGAGPDQLAGGSGDDVYVVDHGQDAITELAGEGIDTVILEGGEFRMGDNLEHLTMRGPVATRAYGNHLDNRITGNGADNILEGAAGADTLAGGGGSDWLVGGSGADVFVFGPGSGGDQVRDFEVGVDRLDLRAFEGAAPTVSHVGLDTVLVFTDGSTITVAGVRLEAGEGWMV